MADPNFPHYVTTSDEASRRFALGDYSAGKRAGTIDFIVVGYVKGAETNIDTKRNQLIEVIEETLDMTERGGNAKETKIIETNSDEGTLYPLGAIRIVVRGIL